MNHAKRTISSLFLGLTVLLATLAMPMHAASAGNFTGEEILPNTVSEQEAAALIKLYDVEDEVEVTNITVKIYNNNDEFNIIKSQKEESLTIDTCRNVNKDWKK